MEKDLEEIIMTIIVSSGSAKSFAMEAISLSKEGKIKEAREALQKADEELGMAHNIQTNLIQEAAQGKNVDINLFMVHAQDHLMTTITTKDLANEFIDLYEKLLINKL
ncbi:MAG: PTS lactose/cellobiose transporter subunit IIA [Defluviitaleaceae bacterium]|nr:PTS lactose/cellobiose transporter subunit IIA [Defluviitaleaceae bacterium]